MSLFKKVIDAIEVMIFITHNGINSTNSIIFLEQGTSQIIIVTNVIHHCHLSKNTKKNRLCLINSRQIKN